MEDKSLGWCLMAKLARYRTGLPNPESDLPGVSLTGAKAGDWEKNALD